MTSTRARKWVRSAPNCLIRAYEDGGIRNGRALLERLLSDTRMATVWRYLGRKVSRDAEWFRVWGDIAYARMKSTKASRFRVTRSDTRDAYAGLADRFDDLASAVSTSKTPMDELAYAVFPDDVLAALGCPNLNALPQLERDVAATNVLICWPSVSELLRGMSRRARTLSDEAMTAPRPDERSSGDVTVRTFVWHLGSSFQSRFGAPLLGSVATIANAVFDGKTKVPVTKEHVRDVLRGCG